MPAGTRVLRDLVYWPGGHERQTLDLYLPAGVKGSPLVVWVHGGAWRSGSKDKPRALTPLLGEGFAVASINYRLSQHAPFPAQIEDCKAAIRWLRANAGQYGYDPNRIGVWGASAGGHLVALLGTTGHVREFDVGPIPDTSSRVQAVCDWFGPTDLLKMDEQAGGKGSFKHDAPDSPESVLIGGPIQQLPDKVRRASPMTYVRPDAPPFLIMHGDQDFTVAIGQSELLRDALRAAGVAVEYKTVPGGGHGFRGADVPALERAAVAFFVKQLKPAP
jgi:acetyl esterase/lipase